MHSIRRWLYRPKKGDKSLLAQFYYADEELSAVTAELDSLDGKKDPERCTTLVAQLRQCQDKVLNIITEMMDYVIPNERASRDFRVKYPDDVLQDNLAGQLWFGAECLAAGSNILNREAESSSMRPLAKAVVRNLDKIRSYLHEQCLSSYPEYTEKTRETFKIFDRLLADFEFTYVSAMVPVKSLHEYCILQDVTVLFSETLQRALKVALLNQDQVDTCDPALMFTVPRLAILAGLIFFPSGPLQLDGPPQNMSELFRPFRNLLRKIRKLLLTLTVEELCALEKVLCSMEEPKEIPITPATNGEGVVEEESKAPKPLAVSSVDMGLAGYCAAVPDHYFQNFFSSHPECRALLGGTIAASLSLAGGVVGVEDGDGKGNMSSSATIVAVEQPRPPQTVQKPEAAVPEATVNQDSDTDSESDVDDCEPPSTSSSSSDGDNETTSSSSVSLETPQPSMVSQVPSIACSCAANVEETRQEATSADTDADLQGQKSEGEVDGASSETVEARSSGSGLVSGAAESGSEAGSESRWGYGSNGYKRGHHRHHNRGHRHHRRHRHREHRIPFQRLTGSSGESDRAQQTLGPELEIPPMPSVSLESVPVSRVEDSACADDEAIALALQACELADREQIRSRFKDSKDLIHRLFVCISGIADQLQTNFAGDLRGILKSVFLMNASTSMESADSSSVDSAEEALDTTRLSGTSECAEGDSSNHTMDMNVSVDSVEANGDDDVVEEEEDEEVEGEGEDAEREREGDEEDEEEPGEGRGGGEGVGRSLGAAGGTSSKSKALRHRHRNVIHYLHPQVSHTIGSDIPYFPPDRRPASPCPGRPMVAPPQGVPRAHHHHHHSHPHHLETLLPSSPPSSHLIGSGVGSPLSPVVGTAVGTPPGGSGGNKGPSWVPDSSAPDCMGCQAPFTVVRRRHHCRSCGKVFCSKCSRNSVPLPQFGHKKPVRVCNRCFVYQVNPFTLQEVL